MILVGVIFFLIFKYKRRISPFFRPFSFRKNQKTTEDGRNAEQFIKEYRSTILTKYSYNDLKKMTSGFKDKLGEGGFGSVYRGKTPDGRSIAVKILERSNQDKSHDFVNEVATIGRIHHLNVIHLLGFSWDGSKRALVYEYMPNGSLGDLLSKEEAGGRLSLGYEKLLEISMGVAQGIEYLHFGCESRIVHLDIKPQNVLLDQNLNPKISDFGLAKMYSREQSAISMTKIRGTIGYIAPEIFMRNVGNPSHKSDVYSYGMLILDIVGGKKYVPSEMSISSEKYFPNWIYDKLVEEEEMEPIDSVVEAEAEAGIAKKMVMVGLWCIQVDPRDRPSMTRVVEMLKGGVEAIQMPPKPFFFSPARLPFEQEITFSNSDSDSTSLVIEHHMSHL